MRHRGARTTAPGWIASGTQGPPFARVHSSIGQPRRRASAASFGSGFTATGMPAASSIGRSLVESA